MKNLIYLFFGTVFGLVLTKTEVISWFRIQEMFRFQSFHMYGVIGSALLVATVSLLLIKRFHAKSLEGEEIVPQGKTLNTGTVIGGLLFGLGWALTGACPGPIFALIGNGSLTYIPVFLAALLGTWVYGLLEEKLPH